jgi:hypothetical protein
LEEHWVHDVLAVQLGGLTEACLPCGRPDVLTSRAVFEVELYKSWRHGARQVLAYSAQCGLPPALALFGLIHRDDLFRFWRKLQDRDPAIGLSWWTGRRRDQITSRARCVTMPHGAWFGTCQACQQRVAVPTRDDHHCESPLPTESHRLRRLPLLAAHCRPCG